MIRTCSKHIQLIASRKNKLPCSIILRGFCEKNGAENSGDKKLSGFAKAFEKHASPVNQELSEDKLQDVSFATLLRTSKLINLGDPQNKIITGKIFHVVDDDLYIDFGWKFHCVCTRPNKNSSAYVRGARVKLRVKDLELSSRFLGSSKDLTILEADCQLVGLLSSPALPPRAKPRLSEVLEV